MSEMGRIEFNCPNDLSLVVPLLIASGVFEYYMEGPYNERCTEWTILNNVELIVDGVFIPRNDYFTLIVDIYTPLYDKINEASITQRNRNDRRQDSMGRTQRRA